MSGRTFQVHANVNADHGDCGLRVTITWYDENGYQVGTQTWRRHVRTLDMDGSDWQAFASIGELHKMMADVVESKVGLVEPDEPLPFL